MGQAKPWGSSRQGCDIKGARAEHQETLITSKGERSGAYTKRNERLPSLDAGTNSSGFAGDMLLLLIVGEADGKNAKRGRDNVHGDGEERQLITMTTQRRSRYVSVPALEGYAYCLVWCLAPY